MNTKTWRHPNPFFHPMTGPRKTKQAWRGVNPMKRSIIEQATANMVEKRMSPSQALRAVLGDPLPMWYRAAMKLWARALANRAIAQQVATGAADPIISAKNQLSQALELHSEAEDIQLLTEARSLIR